MGLSEWSGAFATSLGLLPDPPSVMVEGKTNSIVIDVIATEDNGCPILGFELQTLEGEQWLTLVNGDDLPFAHSGLKPSEERFYRARCRNRLGWSEWSSAPLAVALGQASEPPKLSLDCKAHSIVVTIEPSISDASVAEVLELQHLNGPEQWVVLMYGSGDVYMHTGLSPFETQMYRARSRNAAGWSEWSEASGSSLGSSPDPPSVIAQSKVNAVDVYLEPTDDHGCAIIGYELQTWEEGTWITLYEGEEVHFEHAGLKPMEERRYQARCRNNIGWSPWSSTPCARACPLGVAPLPPALLSESKPRAMRKRKLSRRMITALR
eukprot:TRINITY_DN71184_c0_g1_i1.p2 TRINITY_DN71184_c0_g1~~TRINITY_DN71184_c0_g1_i1.p2  ORF type:complete len:322 (-),score=28.24 TRINITY_DN71184_c0_g1_i1:1696-2661(-)